jgi:hypothetical protein
MNKTNKLVFTVTVDNTPFNIYEFDDHFVACQDGRPVLICNIEDNIKELLTAHFCGNE